MENSDYFIEMIEILLLLSVLGSYAIAISDQFNLTVTIPPGYALQNYLCNGSLKSNTNTSVHVLLDEGEHRISTGPFCTIFNEVHLAITGFSMQNTTVRCEGEGRVLQFTSVRTWTSERIAFINCGIQLVSINDTRITNCTFEKNAILLESSNNISIRSCFFHSNSADSTIGYRYVMLFINSTGNVIIENCTFQNNSAANVVRLLRSTGNITITNCTFQNNSANNSEGGGAVWLKAMHRVGGAVGLISLKANVTFANCTFQNNSAFAGGGAVRVSSLTGNFSITNCKFQDNSVKHSDGGAVGLINFKGKATFANCTFQNNNATDGGGGGVALYGPRGNVSITNCTFQNNSATFAGGAVRVNDLIGNISITNCKFQNDANNPTEGYEGDGGAVVLLAPRGNVSITNCTFQNNSALKDGGAIQVFMGNVSITNCIFVNNVATAEGGALSVNVPDSGNVTITNCTFQNNSALRDGGAIKVSMGNVSITNSRFENNVATGEGGALWVDVLDDSNVIFTNCTFHYNRASGGLGGAMSLDMFGGDVSITNCIFENNRGIDGGALGAKGPNGDSNVTITNCTFQNNSASAGIGGAMSLYMFEEYITIVSCKFQNNNAYFGGAIYITSQNLIFIDSSTFTNNTAMKGAAIYASKDLDHLKILNTVSQLILQDVVVQNNLCSCDEYNEARGGAIYFSRMKVDIFGSTITGSQFSSNSPQGAIQGEDGFLLLHGNITFANNTGENGGAISLSNNVPLSFYDTCRVKFSRNVATGFGGAIYSYSYGAQNDQNSPKKILQSSSDCAINFISYCFNGPVNLITLTDNHAQQGGHAVYATPIYNCINCAIFCFSPTGRPIPTDCPNLISYFNISSLPGDLNEIQILSFPAYVQLCGCSDPNVCNFTSQYQGKVTTYPGRTLRLNVTSVDYGKNVSPSVIYTMINTNGSISLNITLGPRQKAQWIGTVCGTIEYQIYGPEMATLELFLSNYPGNYPTVIEIKLLPCEPGFTLISNSSTGVMTCDCSQFFTSFGVVCDVLDGTVSKNKTIWIGVYNNTLPALASFCPLDYCNSTINKLSLVRPGDLCNGDRTGIICGHCLGNRSVIFGSSKCQVCSGMWLITLLMFALLGVLLVAALFFLNLTVTQGTLYGLIFYANIIQVNTSIFFNQSNMKPLQVVVSFVNLDLGLPLCFYDSMDDADKAGLQFVFPSYLLILTMLVIVVCHYCLQRSPTTSTRSYLYRFPNIIGQRAVGVLSTLIYLSYSKLLRTVIDVLTYSTVHLPTGDMYVWFYDGNVKYLSGKHTVLFVVAMVTCTVFLLPYTFAITFVPIIERYSEHNRLFNYLHKKANQIKPMNDAHYAPYKGEWRWWLGARLWLLVVMYSLNPVYSSENPSLLLSIQATMMILFTVAQAGIKPFGQSHQKKDKCKGRTNFYNQLYNCLDLFYLLNYIALALSMSYILDRSSDQTQTIEAFVGVLVGLYVVALMVTVLYHLIVAILKACNAFDRTREKINGLFKRKDETMVSIELDESTNNAVSNTTASAVNNGLREPLLLN